MCICVAIYLPVINGMRWWYQTIVMLLWPGAVVGGFHLMVYFDKKWIPRVDAALAMFSSRRVSFNFVLWQEVNRMSGCQVLVLWTIFNSSPLFILCQLWINLITPLIQFNTKYHPGQPNPWTCGERSIFRVFLNGKWVPLVPTDCWESGQAPPPSCRRTGAEPWCLS